jgi:hypothetical protein
MNPTVEQTLWNGVEIQRMLDSEVRYKDWRFIVQSRPIMGTLGPVGTDIQIDVDLRLRAEWMAADAETGREEKQQSRWWPLSAHMVKTEIIQTAFFCVLKAEEHEIRETFKYLAGVRPFGTKWTAPFNSHIDINVLAEASEQVDVRVDTRPTAPENQRRE